MFPFLRSSRTDKTIYGEKDYDVCLQGSGLRLTWKWPDRTMWVMETFCIWTGTQVRYVYRFPKTYQVDLKFLVSLFE